MSDDSTPYRAEDDPKHPPSSLRASIEFAGDLLWLSTWAAGRGWRSLRAAITESRLPSGCGLVLSILALLVAGRLWRRRGRSS